MCTISHTLKLCTCKNGSIKAAKNYWILYRHRNTHTHTEGNIALPEDGYENKALKLLNTQTILTALNGGECFDFPVQLRENNILELYFTVPANSHYAEQRFIHEFVYTNGKWVSTCFTPFNAAKQAKQKGKIDNPFTQL